MRKIVLCGELGKRFGRVHWLDVKSPAESIRALCATLKGFKKFVQESDTRRVGYRVLKGTEEMEPRGLLEPFSKKEIFKIVPVFMGASAVGRIVAGAILIAAGAILSITPLAGLSPYLIQAGVALAIGGVAQLLVGAPKTNIKEDDGPKPHSTSFNGAVNTTAQGQPVPLLYGRMIVGSHVISARIDPVKENL